MDSREAGGNRPTSRQQSHGNSLNSIKTIESAPIDLRAAATMCEMTNFNIRDNMKAGPGVVFIEGFGHKDVGPTYQDSVNQRQI